MIKTKKQLFKNVLAIHFIILIIPIAFSLFVYWQSYALIKNETEKNLQLNFKKLKTEIDSKILYIRNLNVQIVWNQEIRWVLDKNQTHDKNFGKETVKTLNMLRNLKILSGIAEKIYIASLYTGNTNYEVFPNDYVSEIIDWNNLIDNDNNEFRTQNVKDNSGYGEDYMIAIQPFPLTEPGLEAAYSVIFFTNKQFMESINKFEEATQGLAAILDENNKIIAASEKINYLEFIDFSYLERGILPEDKVIINSAKSDISNWKYVAFLPEDIIYEKLSSFKTLLLLSLIIFIIIGVTIAWFFAGKTYLKLYEIINVFTKGKNSLIEYKNNYQIFEEYIKNIIDESRDIKEYSNEQDSVLQKNFLAKLIKGDYVWNNISIEEALETYKIDLTDKKFIVMLFFIPDSSKYNYMKKFLKLRFTDNSDTLFSKYLTEINNQQTALFAFEEKRGNELIIFSIEDYLSELLEQADSNGISFFATMSNIVSSTASLSIAYQESLEAMEYSILVGTESIMFYKDIKDTNNGFQYRRFIDTEIKVHEYVKTEEYKKAFKLIENEIDSLYDENITVDLIKTRLAVLKNLVADVLSFITDSADHKDIEIDIEKMMLSPSIPELKNQLSMIFAQINQWADNKTVKKNVSDMAIEYIDKNYTNNNISAQTIADAISVTVPHLSMSFKKQKGVGVLDYIHKLRIETAKKFLQDNKERIKDIAEKSGYYSDIAFIRAFKRYEGITPGQYRESFSNEGVNKT